MQIVNIAALIILILYAVFLMYGAAGFLQTKTFILNSITENHTKTTIIICARNEQEHIGHCLNSILAQNFNAALLEIIVVSDGSTDNTFSIAEKSLQGHLGLSQVIKIADQQGKKKCISEAIALCNSELIITRDADTYTDNPNWLRTVVSFYENSKKEFIIAPVQIESEPVLLSQLQNFENMALTVVTGGYAFFKSPFLCNGANLAFTKKLFEKVNGYSSHLTIPSGDDVLFLEDVKKTDPQTIAYLKQKEASVFTYSAKKTSTFVEQRTRWASKFKINPNPINFLMGFILFFAHFFTLFYLSKLLFIPHLGLFGLFFVLSRLFIDFLLLFLASRFYGNSPNWLLFLPLNLMYSLYVLVITTLALFYKPKWK
jgi:glycosyltransferase involved in cell wall biosynthesis